MQAYHICKYLAILLFSHLFSAINLCKVMVNVLKAREDLAYQLALLSTELTEIFANAPVTPQSSESSTSTDTGGSRKPIEGDCPVCVSYSFL